MLKVVSLLVAAIVLGACAPTVYMTKDGGQITEGSTVYNLTNLHPDMRQLRMYAMNYQREGLLPMCTGFQVTKSAGDFLRLRTLEGGVTFHYFLDKYTPDFATNVNSYFATTCSKAKVSNMSSVDQKGIRIGKALRGMTKEAVILAIGYPPVHATLSLERDQWTYWINRFKRMVINFDASGRVSNVKL